MARIVQSDLFRHRGPLTSRLRKELACRGTGTQIKDLWGRLGWEQQDGAAGVVASVTPGTGRIKGLRWVTAGAVITGTVKLKSVMPGAEGDLDVVIKVDGESLTWPASDGRPRNISDWIFLGEREGELQVRRRSSGEILGQEEVATLAIGDLALRASLLVVSPAEAWIAGHVLRASMEGLTETTGRWGLDHGINSVNIPTVGVRHSGVRTRQQISLMVQERPGDRVGFGLLPVLEEVSDGMAPVSRDELERQLCLFLRSARLATNVKDWPAAMAAAAAPAQREVVLLWPEYQGDTEQGAADLTFRTEGSESSDEEEEEEEEDGLENFMRGSQQGNPGGQPGTARQRPRSTRRPQFSWAELGKMLERQAERQSEKLREQAEQNSIQMQLLTQKLTEAISQKGESGKKRKAGEEWKSEDKEVFEAEIKIKDEAEIKVKDDGHEEIAWELRAKLLTPNGKPEDWWTKEVPVKTGPKLGANLYMDHMMGGRINETTACKLYDRREILELKHFLTKNSGHLGALRQKVRTDYNTSGALKTSIETDYKGASDCFEAVEGVLNLAAYLHKARYWDYMGLALLRAGHQIRWFAGVSKSPQDQAKTIERWVNEILVVGAQRGRLSKPPPDYDEMLRWAGRICHSANLPEHGLMTGDPYSNSRTGRQGGGEQDLDVKQLAARLNRLQRKAEGNGGWRQGGSDSESGGSQGYQGTEVEAIQELLDMANRLEEDWEEQRNRGLSTGDRNKERESWTGERREPDSEEEEEVYHED